MTPTTQQIFENFQIRKSKKQKQAFRAWALETCRELGYTATVEKAGFGARNIVVGNLETAKVVYAAHYDTCSVLPFSNFITPKNFLVYLLYQVAIVALLLVPMFLVSILVGLLIAWLDTLLPGSDLTVILEAFLPLLIWLAVMWLLTGGPANKHTANDNTSGVTVLFDLMAALPANQRDAVAFVFFDLDEAGLLGSSGFASKHKKQMKQKPLINFDCVSDGQHIILAVRRKAKHLQEALAQAFPSTADITAEVLTRGVFYPSDQANFNQGIGVASLKKSRRLGLLYMDRIHTPRDTVYREENIAYLVACALRLVQLL